MLLLSAIGGITGHKMNPTKVLGIVLYWNIQ